MSHHRPPPDPHHHKPHRPAHPPQHGHPIPSSVAQEMQIRALREALYRAARETDTLRREADALREALKCERQRHTDLELRYKQVVQAVGSRPSEIDSVREENRRLRALIADGSAERLKLLEDLRLATPPQPVRKAPVPADPEVTYEL